MVRAPLILLVALLLDLMLLDLRLAECLNRCAYGQAQPVYEAVVDPKDGEFQTWLRYENGVRAVLLAPQTKKPKRTRALLLFATPNGNSLEQSLGCRKTESLDWRFDIQHIAAQYRWLANNDSKKELVLAVVQAPQLSWPEFRRSTSDAATWIRSFVESLRARTDADEVQLSCHSGGGSFLWGWMNAHPELPDFVRRIVFLDANYSYSDADLHGDKLWQWLQEPSHRLIVMAYDDREILLNGKKVIDDDGGTYRATQRMRRRFDRDATFQERTLQEYHIASAMEERLQLIVHGNPENKILHTSLVGDFNGFLYSHVSQRDREADAWLMGPRRYDSFLSPLPFTDPIRTRASVIPDQKWRELNLPSRPDGALTGTQFIDRVATFSNDQREKAIREAILLGNVPRRSRWLTPIQVTGLGPGGQVDSATYHVAADYMAIGSDYDCVRIPLTPMSAVTMGRTLGASLITSKISDDVYCAASLKLAPQPLTQRREAPSTFLEHHRLIEEQRKQTIGAQHETDRLLIAGVKKDLIFTNKLAERPNRVAIYGWHSADGVAIQPVYAGHVNHYVDYSHALRWVLDEVTINGKTHSMRQALAQPRWSHLFSNEGPIDCEKLSAFQVYALLE